MLIEQTKEKLRELRLHGMLKGLEQQLNSPEFVSLSFDERLGLLVDCEATSRESKKLTGLLRAAKLKHQACVENYDFRKQRGLDKATLRQLSLCDWVRQHRNILIDGPTGVGKTYLACALAHKACQHGFKSLYERAPRLFNALTIARASGKYCSLLATLSKPDVMIIDDFGLMPLTDDMARDLLEIVDDRHGAKSTIFASQFPVDEWHSTISNPTLADAIVDRVVHNSYKLKLKGPSMRKNDNEETPSTSD